MSRSSGLMGLLATVLVTLGIIYVYNRFSGKNIAMLGASSAPAPKA